MPVERVRRVVDVWADRYSELGERNEVRYVGYLKAGVKRFSSGERRRLFDCLAFESSQTDGSGAAPVGIAIGR